MYSVMNIAYMNIYFLCLLEFIYKNKLILQYYRFLDAQVHTTKILIILEHVF